jgi:hypothetical protein
VTQLINVTKREIMDYRTSHKERINNR